MMPATRVWICTPRKSFARHHFTVSEPGEWFKDIKYDERDGRAICGETGMASLWSYQPIGNHPEAECPYTDWCVDCIEIAARLGLLPPI